MTAPTRKKTRLVARAALTAACLSMWPAAAVARPATALVADPPDDAPLAFGGSTELSQLGVGWDGSSTLAVRVTYAAPPQSRSLAVLVSSAARDETDPNVHACDPDSAESFTVEADDGEATLELPFVDGQLRSALSIPAPNVVIYTFSSPVLQRAWGKGGSDPFVCVSGRADRDDFYGSFTGKILKVTPTTSRDGVMSALRQRFHSTPGSVRCPSAGIEKATDPSTDGPGRASSAFCAFTIPKGTRHYRFGTTNAFLIGGAFELTDLHQRVWPNSVKQCGVYPGPHGGWVPAPGFGAGTSATAERVSCRTARRIAQHWNGRHSYRGYRCVVLKRGYEYVSVRCSRPGGRVVRFESGS